MQQYVFPVVWSRPPGPALAVVLVGKSYGPLPRPAQERIRDQVAGAAARSGLAGAVALAWPLDGDKVAYDGPEAHRAAIVAQGYRRLQAQVNKKLVCTF